MKRILVHIIPNSRKTEVKTIAENIYRVKVTAPPIDGLANKELLKILSKHFKTHKNNITFIKGVVSDKKIIEISEE